MSSLKGIGWFRHRTLGFGVSPSSPIGWLVTLLFVLAIRIFAYVAKPDRGPYPVWFYVAVVIAGVAFCALAFYTAKPKPKG